MPIFPILEMATIDLSAQYEEAVLFDVDDPALRCAFGVNPAMNIYLAHPTDRLITIFFISHHS